MYEHHQCHAASAHLHLETVTPNLVADGLGDGITLSIWRKKHSVSKRFDHTPFIGLLKAFITDSLLVQTLSS